MTANNVVQLFGAKTPQTQGPIEVTEDEEAFNLARDIASDTVMLLQFHGYDINGNPETIRDIIMLMENVRAICYRSQNQKIGIHDFNDSMTANIAVKEAHAHILREFRDDSR